MILSAKEEEEFTIIEGQRSIGVCGDVSQDLEISGDMINMFFMMGEAALDPSLQVFIMDLKNTNNFGIRTVTLKTTADDNLSSSVRTPSLTINLDQVKPNKDGDSFCTVIKGNSGVKNYFGYVPIFSDFNGEYGLI